MNLPPMGTPGKCPAHLRPWTQAEDELLLSLSGKMLLREIAELLPERTPHAIACRASYLRQRFPGRIPGIIRHWTAQDDRFIRRHRHSLTARQMAQHLDRTMDAVKARARSLGISLFKCGDLHPCTRHSDEDVALIRELRDAGMHFREIAEKFDLSQVAVRYLCYRRLTAVDAITRELLPK